MENQEYQRHSNETDFDYALRLLRNKSSNTYDIDYSELMELAFKQNLSSDESRKRYYGQHMLADLYDNQYKDKVKILSLSDLHFPYNLPVEELRPYRGKVDILHFNGDEEDCFAVSKFLKRYRQPFVDEMVGCRKLLIDIINYIEPKKVIFNYGNHNERLITYFSEKLHEDLLQLIPKTNLDFICDIGFWKHDHENKTKTFFEPLTKVFEGTGIEVIYTKEWHNRLGRTIFCHPKAFKSGILSTTEKAYLYFLQRGEEPADLIVMAHTHNSAVSRYGSTYLLEQGCYCLEPDYAQDGKMFRPQSNGYVYIVQDKEGRFIYSDSKLVMI